MVEEGDPAASGKIHLYKCFIRILQKITIMFLVIIIKFLCKSYRLSSLRKVLK